MKGKPSVVTPTAAIGTSNQFAALAETEEAITEAEIPDDEYLPNLDPVVDTDANPVVDIDADPVEGTDHPTTDPDTTSSIDDDSSISSISTMSSTDDTNDFSKAKISALVERIQTNCTKAMKAHTHTHRHC